MARGAERLDDAAKSIKEAALSQDQLVFPIQADVVSYQSIVDQTRDLLSEHGTPDYLINAAGVARPGEIETMDLDLYRWMMDINFHGTVNSIKAFLPGMIARKSGHIVNISSAAGFLGLFGYTAYGASKFAVKGFTDSLRLEVKPHHIHVSIVFPTDTDTPQLVEDNAHKPPLLVAIEEGSPVSSAEFVAQKIIRGIEKKRYIITPGWYATLLFLATGLTGGGLVYHIMDWMMADARRKIRRNPGKYAKANHH
jgi:3-dehydrosphinganine reductase